MKLKKSLRGFVVALACSGMFMGHLAHAAGPQPTTSTKSVTVVRDVALATGGVLKGQLIDAQGTPQAKAQVAVVKDGKLVARTETDKQGNFAVANLNGGVFEVHTANGSGLYRVWTSQTAPPSALAGVLIVNGDQVVRGIGEGGVLEFLANPWVLGGIVACAIAIPLALDNGS